MGNNGIYLSRDEERVALDVVEMVSVPAVGESDLAEVELVLEEELGPAVVSDPEVAFLAAGPHNCL